MIAGIGVPTAGIQSRRLNLRHIAKLRQAPFSAAARALSHLGLGRLRNLDPKPPVQRDEWDGPGDLINIDIKTLARFQKVGHRISAGWQRGLSSSVGYEMTMSPLMTPDGWPMPRCLRTSRSRL